jgi:hypothetical protein
MDDFEAGALVEAQSGVVGIHGEAEGGLAAFGGYTIECD